MALHLGIQKQNSLSPSTTVSDQTANATQTSSESSSSMEASQNCSGEFEYPPDTLHRRSFGKVAVVTGAAFLAETLGRSAQCLAAEHTESGKVLSLNSSDSTINVSDSTFNVHQKVKVTINGRPGKFDDIKPGHDVTLGFGPKEDLVWRIKVTGEPNEAVMAGLPWGQVQRPSEMGGLSELPKAYIQCSPWVSHDGLTLYWSAASTSSSPVRVLYRATRNSPQEKFRNPESLFPAEEFSLRGGEREVVFRNDGALLTATRLELERPFCPPWAISDVSKDGLLSAPRLAIGGLKLYCDRELKPNYFETVVFTRESIFDTWGSPQEVEIPYEFRGKLRNLSPIGTGWAVGCLHNQEKPGPSVFILREGAGPNSFTSCEPIKVGGEFVSGFFPHYSPHTGELFLMGIGPGKGESVGFIFKVRVPDLCR